MPAPGGGSLSHYPSPMRTPCGQTETRSSGIVVKTSSGPPAQPASAHDGRLTVQNLTQEVKVGR